MNIIEHFTTSRKYGLGTALLTMLPDVFVVLRKLIPLAPIQNFCLKAHNTQKAIDMAYKINGCLGKVWELHRKQDLANHPSYRYELNEHPDR